MKPLFDELYVENFVYGLIFFRICPLFLYEWHRYPINSELAYHHSKCPNTDCWVMPSCYGADCEHPGNQQLEAKVCQMPLC